ncbi:MAG: signal peptidase I [Terriglobia bacterium]
MSDNREPEKLDTLREYVDTLLVTVILALFGTTFILQAFKIPSSSMEATLLVGDHLLVNKFALAEEPGAGWGLLPYRAIHRGDIVVFKYPFPPHQHFVKRIVGLPGDRLKIVDGQVYINGRMLPEPYMLHRRSLGSRRLRDDFPLPGEYFYSFSPGTGWDEEMLRWVQGDELVLPPGKYFALGDNRDNSQDSRYWGFVDRKNIIGRPLVIYWSYEISRGRGPRRNSAPGEALRGFFSRIRWDRLLRMVR